MKLFKRRKNKDILDLTERYRKQQEKIAEMQEDTQETGSESSQGGAFSFLGNLATSNSTDSQNESGDYVDVNEVQDKRKKLAKRLMDITNKLEEISNQIYHLQQRLELVERKMGVGNY